LRAKDDGCGNSHPLSLTPGELVWEKPGEFMSGSQPAFVECFEDADLQFFMAVG